MLLSPLERRVADEIQEHRDELVTLTTDLIRYDTTAFDANKPPGDEARLQEYLAARLRRHGATIDLWEPDPADIPQTKLVPSGLHFRGRPQLAACFAGSGSGRSLLLNGHIDVVSSEPRDRWSSDPNQAEVRNGQLYGRGSCDMKGGVAAMVFAAEMLSRMGVCLAGDLIVCTVTDEETTGAGGAAAVAHGVRADAGIVPEPSCFDVWTACRGSLIPTITVEGRPGHAGLRQPHWSEGGAVNAIDKMAIVMAALSRLQQEWNERPDQRHPLLSPGDIVPAVISGGEWIVSFPASCRLTYHVGYLPGQADELGWGGRVEREITECIEAAARTDPWLSLHPPVIQWDEGQVPSAEISPDEPIVSAVLSASYDVGREGRIAGLDNWHDGATFIRLGGIPMVGFGPGKQVFAHTIDEHVSIEDLVRCAQAIAVSAMRFCGLGASEVEAKVASQSHNVTA